jgi:pimeloyl-ACP methyl ester carboxylesterase
VWDLPDWAAVFRSFGGYPRVILFYRRGLGVSDRPTSPDVMAIEKGMDDIRAVLDEVGSERAALLGYESGGTVMVLFAASYPDRVSGLALFSPLAFYWKTPDFPWGSTEQHASDWRIRVESGWGTEEFWRRNAEGMGQTNASDEEIERYARFTRLCASPQAALAIDEVERQVDVRAVLPQIQVPTLVMSTRGDMERGIWGAGPWIAEQITAARYVEIDDDEHFPVRPDVLPRFRALPVADPGRGEDLRPGARYGDGDRHRGLDPACFPDGRPGMETVPRYPPPSSPRAPCSVSWP